MSKNNIDDAKLEVKNFLINANRPYSCQDVANNFQNKYNKSLIQKSLDFQKSIQELQNHLDRLRSEIDELRQKSEEFNESKNVEENIDDNVEKKSRLTVKRKKLIDEWRKRKRMATGIIQTIMENCPKKKKDFFEEVGIETDEDYNVIIPSNV
ncbi:PSMC3 interacting protein [Dermatophagoides pteronyssinus]|uniref:Homologous-pairing protein 2 homolog n=1 Tax=Dermatophagoides pteronyssinus TaxID=6956 RepID=A0ABQ8J0M4_DERPT|nr:PSMC3 interacting protein [Dermatophagoides pteronyssinus]